MWSAALILGTAVILALIFWEILRPDDPDE